MISDLPQTSCLNWSGKQLPASAACLAVFNASDFRFIELTEVIRLGLIGGGMDPEEGDTLVKAYAPRMSVTDLYGKALPIIDLLMFGKVNADAE